MSSGAVAYLPSSQFATIVGSLFLAGVLVWSASYLTSSHTGGGASLAAAPSTTEENWRAALEQIQATAPQLPEAPSQEVTDALLNAAQSNNVTDSVARSLLVNLSSASSQGLGADIPTQESIIASAAAAITPTQPQKTYTQTDLRLIAATKESEHAYGNAVMVALSHHTGATSQATLNAMNEALSYQDSGALSGFPTLQREYRALATELAGVAVPKTLTPLHLQALQALEATAATYDDLAVVLKDPLRGLRGLQQYQLQVSELGRVFTAVGEALNRDGILFTKDEPGAGWALFASDK